MNCYICSNNNLSKFLDLGMHPPPLNFVSKDDLLTKQETFPLQVYFCNDCGLVQLGDAVDPNVMFKNYLYTSGVSTAFKNHLSNFAETLIDKFSPNKNDLVIDIASNDGTLLNFFQNFGLRVLGIEPSNIADIANENGIQTVKEFFNESIAKNILKNHGQAKIITITNAFAHIKDLDSIMNGIKLLLNENGVFVSESQYLGDIIEKLEYDTIYHEHLRYYSLRSLVKLFDIHGMEVFDCERISSHGGSIRVYASFKGKFSKTENIKQVLDTEDKLKLLSFTTYEEFANRVYENRKKLNDLLKDIKLSEKTIVGISAPARSSTVLNFCEIDSTVLDYVAEKSSLKIGKFTPGSHIEVVNDEKLIEKQPDFALLLSWHLSDSIISKIKNDGYKGKIIVPLPDPKII